MKTIIYNKLVRDRIPEIIAAAGKKCDVVTLSKGELAEHLDAKLAEEVGEYLKSGEVVELADLAEVIRAIVHLRGLTDSEFEGLREEKRLSNGGFDKGYLLVGVTEPD